MVFSSQELMESQLVSKFFCHEVWGQLSGSTIIILEPWCKIIINSMSWFIKIFVRLEYIVSNVLSEAHLWKK